MAKYRIAEVNHWKVCNSAHQTLQYSLNASILANTLNAAWTNPNYAPTVVPRLDVTIWLQLQLQLNPTPDTRELMRGFESSEHFLQNPSHADGMDS